MSSYASNVVPKECEGMRLMLTWLLKGCIPRAAPPRNASPRLLRAQRQAAAQECVGLRGAMCLNTRPYEDPHRARARRGRYSARHSL